MIDEHAVDAVLILSAASAHYPIASAALRADIHVLIEKPFTITARAGMRLIELAAARNLTLGVAENQRYVEGTRANAWAIHSGQIGKVQMVLSGAVGNVWSPDKIVARTAWRHKKVEAGGGGTMDIGSHLFDLLRYQCGEIDEVSALARTFEPVRYLYNENGRELLPVECDADDTFMALLQFKSGAIGNLVFSWAGHGERTGFDNGGAIYGAHGCLKGGRLVRDGQPTIEVSQVYRGQESPAQIQHCFPDGITDGFALEMRDFIQAVGSGTQPETSGSEGLKDIAPGLAILESSFAGRAIKVADVESCRVEGYQQEINTYWGSNCSGWKIGLEIGVKYRYKEMARC